MLFVVISRMAVNMPCKFSSAHKLLLFQTKTGNYGSNTETIHTIRVNKFTFDEIKLNQYSFYV